MESWEFPAELDEFLEFCVEEHNGDFDAISREFLEVASGLDEQLAGRAEEAFSAASLRQRYLQLHGTEGTDHGDVVDAVDAPSVAATSVTTEQCLDADWKEQALNEDAPSQFSVLTDSLQDRVRRIYNNVQLRLPSAYAEEGSDSERLSEGRRSEAPSEDGALKDAAVRLFGSADLGHVVADLSTGDGVDGVDDVKTNEVGPHGSPAGMPADRDPSGLIARALRGEDEESDDSAADDFRAMRKAVKEHSKQAAADPKPVVRKQVKPKVQIKLRKKTTSAKPKDPKATPGFVRLELVESASEAEEEELSSEDEELEEEQDSHLRVLSRLEKTAPNGECPWDVWLQATRSWPQLKAKLNSPDFCRQNGDLKVNFDIDLLRRLIQEEKEARAAARQARIDNIENQKSRVNEYIEEAERRREMIKGRIGGFLLAPRNEKLEEILRKSAKQEAQHAQNAQVEKIGVFKPLPRSSLSEANVKVPPVPPVSQRRGQFDAMHAVMKDSER